MKKVLLLIIASIFSFNTANAADVTFGIGTNEAVFAAEGRERNYDYAGSLEKTTVEYGAFKDKFLNAYVEVSNGVLGIGINYIPSTISTPENVNTQVQGGSSSADTKVSADFDDWLTLYAIARLPRFGLYLKAGMSQVDINVKESGDVGTYNNTDSNGVTLGVGIEKMLDNGVGFRAEVSVYDFDDVTSSNGKAAGAADANVVDVSDMYGAVGTISLLKRF